MVRRSLLGTSDSVAISIGGTSVPALESAATRNQDGVDFQIVARRTALLNVDLQNCFVEGSPVSAIGGPALLSRLNQLAEACREAGVLVIHTAHVLRDDGSNMGVLGEIVPLIKGGMIAEGSRASALHPRLFIAPGDIVLKKPRFGAFHGTDLELILRSRGIDTVIVGGIATSVCCETTAREAAARDFRVLFLSDGTATFDFQGVAAAQLQAATCATMTLFGQVLSLRQMHAKLAAPPMAQSCPTARKEAMP